MKKYVLIHQHWGVTINDKSPKINKIKNIQDLEYLEKEFGVRHIITDQPERSWGYETYELLEDGTVKFLFADYDSSD